MKKHQLVDHIAEGPYQSKNMLHINTGPATTEQLDEVVRNALTEAVKVHKQNITTSYHVNIVMNRDRLPFGYGYVWFDDPKALNIIIGLNADGSKRIEKIEDPDWVPPPLEFGNLNTSKSWADMADEDECPMIIKQLPPIVTLKSYVASDAQIAMINESDEYRLAPGEWEYTADRTGNGDDDKIPDVIWTSRIPDGITAADIKNLFNRYSSSKRKGTRYQNGREIEDTYPMVNFNQKERTAYISFDPATHEAQFALKMTRLSIIQKESRKVTLIFNKCNK